ncbi:MAG: hypothetical protein Q4E89_08060 [Eubacteriales bacterium]|nr:hypothetical protein [Eubacteriales bacterium]
MINEEKVKLMTKLAMYEKTEGEKYLPISRYYRSDYIGLALIRNFFVVTIGYVLVLLALGAYYAEYLLNNIHRMNLIVLGTEILVGYAVIMAAFSILTYIQYSVKYYMAKKSVKKYYDMLTQLNKMYSRTERKSRTAGRRR